MENLMAALPLRLLLKERIRCMEGERQHLALIRFFINHHSFDAHP
jgi:hypothetical protein